MPGCSANLLQGGKKKSPKVHKGPKGGKYIIKKGEKVYLSALKK